ncbi:hypothetical protein [Histidinibacterium lentulum]|uniref:Uncharacterized protein n=1 Tax=Histidinibacterium lentulum TaxID=2480588 RepID=A0A3N2R9K1_9RHOB|nr:hypothetical protein [Histidinibacterium lentulum]ROU04097.1 hypothetical protein EAT49_01480 [Histidinibacterium lentulum]
MKTTDEEKAALRGTGPPGWYGPALGAIWAVLILQVMLPFPANAVVATTAAATGGYLVWKAEGGLGGRSSRRRALLFLLLLALLGLSLFAYHIVNIGWAPPVLGLVAFGTAWALPARNAS